MSAFEGRGRGRGRGGDSGRGGFGGRDSGRGGGRDSGRGGRGRGNPHMGQNGLVLGELRARGCDDASILAVISPPDKDRVRPVTLSNTSMPGLENWRFDTPIGRRLDRKKHTIVTNHFRVNAAGIPGCIYQYDVSVFAQKDGVWSRDVVVDGDLRMCISILKSAREKHPEWTPQGCELAYDGRATLFSSARMPLPDKDKAGVCHGGCGHHRS